MSSVPFKLTVVFLFLILISCHRNGKIGPLTDTEILQINLKIPSQPYNYASPNVPAFFQDQFITIQNNTPASNLISDWGATLGRVLFYDKRLSLNQSISCASCHQQAIGFTDTARLSVGFNGGLTKRHSMSLVNAVYYSNGRFFWDERAASLEEQVLRPIQDPIEMGMTLDALLQRLNATSFYPILFKNAFGDSRIDTIRVAKALSQFVRSMVSYQSKYDQGRAMVTSRNQEFPNFTFEENLGKKIFLTNPNVTCFSCHNTDVFIADNPRNNGIHFDNADSGIYTHTHQAGDIGKFKVPSLKNVALRKRFMHDGSIVGLDGVIDHYNFNIQPNPNLDEALKNSTHTSPAQMNLSATDVNALKAFLETLTDEEMIRDEKFSSPFR